MKPVERLRVIELDIDEGPPERGRFPGVRLWFLPVSGGLLTALVVGGVGGAPTGLAVAIALRFAATAQSTAAERRRRHRESIGLPLALDIAAACLSAGAPLPHALTAAAAVATGKLGTRLQQTARTLRLGGNVTDAFEPLNGITGAERVASAVRRSHHTGAALAEGLSDVASRLREEQVDAVTAAAQRAGVWLVLPLCLCFLPAFMLAGLVPVVLSIFDSVLTVH